MPNIGLPLIRGSLIAAALTLLPPAFAYAEEPSGPVEITTASSAGSTPDALMRLAAKFLNDEKIVTPQIVVVNRTGANWANAINHVMEHPGDPNALLTLGEPIVAIPITRGTPIVYDKFTPLGIIVQTQLVILAQPNAEAKSLTDIVNLAKEKPGQVRVSGSNPSSADAQIVGLIEKTAGIDLTFIPHDGGGAAQATFLGGNTELITVTFGEGLPLIKAGKAKAIAILNDERSTLPDFKDIPTAREQGVNVVRNQAFGLLGPPKLDPKWTKYWDDALTKLAANPAWIAALEKDFLGTQHINSKDLAAYLQQMHNTSLEVLRTIGAAKM